MIKERADQDDHRPHLTSGAGPVPTQMPLPPLAHALDLLDGLLRRDDLPLAARHTITEVLADLLDVRPPFPPPTPDPDATDPTAGPWATVLERAAAALRQLTMQHGVDLPPAVVLGYALATRRLRDTLTTSSERAGETT